MGNRMSVTIISSLSAVGPMEPASSTPRPQIAAVPVIEPDPMEEERATTESTKVPFPEEPRDEAMISSLLDVATPPPTPAKERKPAVRRQPAPDPQPLPEPAKPAPPKKEKYVQARQEVMEFEPITRGRFEKSEPTIVEGQDLDVPTFLRKNVRVK
jgi:cell division protein FtsZ